MPLLERVFGSHDVTLLGVVRGCQCRQLMTFLFIWAAAQLGCGGRALTRKCAPPGTLPARSCVFLTRGDGGAGCHAAAAAAVLAAAGGGARAAVRHGAALKHP